MNKYTVRPLKDDDTISVEVPGSKSITNRALLLAAMRTDKCTLTGVLFSEDSRAFLSCLKELGFELTINEPAKTVTITGTGGRIPNREASINVGSAGTAARFLTVFLAFAGGDYFLDATPQMRRRPMEALLTCLKEAGVTIECTGEEGHFPFRLRSKGISVNEMSTDTDISSQYASAMLMSAPLLDRGLRVNLTGSRTDGSYINITLRMMDQFGYSYMREGNSIFVNPACTNSKSDSTTTTNALSNPDGQDDKNIPTDFTYKIEPDVSAACYFYAMSPICGKTVQVKNVHLDSMQGDIRFLKTLEDIGCIVCDTSCNIPDTKPTNDTSDRLNPDNGLVLYPPTSGRYPGIDISMKDYSDQTMTMAVVAAFANSPSTIRNIGHIRYQESDRLNAIITELNRLGCKCEPVSDDNTDATGLHIEPPLTDCADTDYCANTDHSSDTGIPNTQDYETNSHGMHGADIETYEDHRIAMAFSLTGLRIPGVSILNPMCCKKTFENYFEVLDSLCIDE
ncbi:MAG: 3-phosphoshikimate 1-carboxyvinyltransferase [Lachnospiraceae bacterium]|nr:3-phosphoshikimate 1-carboxyvinyltransferase [Lachnospiraceae bacterium]